MYDPQRDEKLRKLGKSQLSDALMSNRMDEVQALLDEGQRFDLQEEPYLLGQAARKNNIDAMHVLLENGYDPHFRDEVGRTPLHEASQPEAAKVLLDRGADINAQDAYGNTPLHREAGMGEDMASFLMEQGADWMIANMAGLTPLALATRWADVMGEDTEVPQVMERLGTKALITASLANALSPKEIMEEGRDDREERQERMHQDLEHQEAEHRQTRKRRM